MNGLDIIKQIEEAFGFRLKQVPEKEILRKDFYSNNEFYFTLSELSRPNFPFKGARSYSIDKEGSITGLSLDYSPVYLVNFLEIIEQLNKISFLGLKNSYLPNFTFLKELKSLTSLDLSYNQISDFSFLKELKSLTSLYLRNTKISDVSFFKELKSLTSLDLRNNQISDVSFLKELKSLTSLDLRNNQISDVSFLKELKSLTSLDLRNTKISDFSFLKELKSLTSLDLRNTKISDVSFLKELKSLTSLYLSYNQISDFSFLKELKSLTSLDLRNTKISDVSFLKELKSLTSLDLRNTKISDVSFLKELKSLTSLDLSYNQISDFSFLKELKSLTSLDLSYNQISYVSFLKELKSLTSLDLSSNQISEVSFLKELKSLTSLYLRNNKISDFSFLKELKSLTSLDLSFNLISDFSFLKELKSLTSLDLSYNQISDVSFLKELKSLTSLELRNNQISDVTFLNELKSLTSLYLRNNQISDVSFLKELKSLTSLDLRNTKISDVSFLKELKSLTSLDLSYNQISDVSFLKELKSLTSLYLSSTKISEVSFLKELKSLTTLYLSSTKISEVSFLKELKSLTSLYLRNTKISDFSFLKELKSVTTLDLSYNQISEVSFLKELKSLTSLYLSSTKISEVSFLKELKSLTSLDLSFNQISNFSFLKELKSLTSLDLRNTKIRDVSFLKELKSLNNITLSNNKIEAIPLWLAEKDLQIRIDEKYAYSCINLFGNEIEIPPKQIVSQGNEAIREWYRQSEKYDQEKAYEAKVMVIGEPNAGKTTFMELLFNEKYQVPQDESLQPSTLGVNVMPDRIFKNPDKDSSDITANIWDFGGQDIQYMLHQYFLSDDSVYVLVTDGRSGNTRYGYWFHIINLLGKNSPIIVILNRHVKQTSVIAFNSIQYKKTFQELDISDLGEVDFGNLDYRWENFINSLAGKLSGLRIMGQPTLKPWKYIREEITSLKKNYITLSEFEEICEKKGLEETSEAHFLLKYFHKIGFALNFEEATLQNTVFLNPNWITHAIYDALKSDDEIFGETGKFEKEKLYQHWQRKECNEIHRQPYSLTECNYLLNLMLKDHFDVCYELKEKPGFYLVPRKLPDKSPEYNWDTNDNLHFRFQYPFMPEGLISRLIVRLNESIDGNNVWLNGVIIKDDNITAEIIQNETTQTGIKYIGIRIMGVNPEKRRRLLRSIRKEIEHIHKHTFPYINYSEMVVCNCETCSKDENPNFYPYEELKELLEMNETVKPCTKGRQRVEIKRMIDDVYTKDDFDESGNKKFIETNAKTGKHPILKVFISYSHEQKKQFEIFKKDFKSYSTIIKGLKLEVSSDLEIPIGSKWDGFLKGKVDDCDIMILLVSQEFMNSDYIKKNEFGRVIENLSKGKKILFAPVYFTPCNFDNENELRELQFFKPTGDDYGEAAIKDFSYSDLIRSNLKDGQPIENPNLKRYMLNFIEKLEMQIKANFMDSSSPRSFE